MNLGAAGVSPSAEDGCWGPADDRRDTREHGAAGGAGQEEGGLAVAVPAEAELLP